MTTVTTRHLGPLASRITHKPCRVEIGHHLPFGIDGTASHDATEFVIHLHPHLLERRDVSAVAETFWHECAHIALGQVRAVPSTITPTSLRAALRAGYTAAQRRQEDAADAWAAQVRRVIPDASLWRWIID